MEIFGPMAAAEGAALLAKVLDTVETVIELSRSEFNINGTDLNQHFSTVPDDPNLKLVRSGNRQTLRARIELRDFYRVFGRYIPERYERGDVNYRVSSRIPIELSWEAGWEANGCLHVHNLHILVAQVEIPFFTKIKIDISLHTIQPDIRFQDPFAGIRVTFSLTDESTLIGAQKQNTGTVTLYGDGSVECGGALRGQADLQPRYALAPRQQQQAQQQQQQQQPAENRRNRRPAISVQGRPEQAERASQQANEQLEANQQHDDNGGQDNL